MAILNLDFEEEINVSAQVGDNVYYIVPNTNGEFDWANTSNIMSVNYPISSINGNTISIEFPGAPPAGTSSLPSSSQAVVNIPPQGAFIMFGKDNSINVSGLTGYFAEVEFRNNSNEKIELFAVGAGISESSQ